MKKSKQRVFIPEPEYSSSEEDLEEPSDLESDDGEEVESSEEMEDEPLDRESKLKNSLAEIPFGQLMELKKNGKATFQKNVTETAIQTKKKKSKGAPAEMSSKIPVTRFRVVVPNKQKFKSRDPRFSDLSGSFNENLFKHSYPFLDDYRKEELEELKKRAKKEKDPVELEKTQKAIAIMTQQMSAEKRKESKQKFKSEMRKKEQEAVAKGKKPFYLKKSAERKAEMVEKFKQLKKDNRLDSYMATRMARNAKKDHRMLPTKRRNQ
eukprot:TRINITY_DN7999_c0_g1_i1.p1 TRINITY_DN7999_c0_g1~~TRINITY_DN7999_c0_g1_i1.p1  ORF type:complete len:278 (+),score=107.59 TRINITY_DN7999_c0_g1_i1:40-834(+)